MADTNCIRRDCVACDSPLSGLQKLYCGARCRNVTPHISQTCRQCGSGFIGRKRLYCSKACNATAQMRKRGIRPMEQYRASVRKDANYFWCEQCHKSTHRPLGGNGTRNRFCSMACRVDCSRDKQGEIDALQRIARSWRVRIRRESYQDIVLKKHSLQARVNVCGGCGARYCPMYGYSGASYCVPCAPEMRRRAKRMHKAKREVRKRGLQAENVDPFKVFDRDGWRCQLCNRPTPKRLRGTYEDMAPELDHIIPLSLGGAHSYINTQCACRKCNSEKSNRPLGQLLMFG